jgi:hypothetical protein
MIMKRLILSLSIIVLSLSAIRADEGMWLPSLIKERISDMQQKGFKLTAEDLYSINKASLKDAIVHFNGGCTGELISDEGLLITNHHCGFGQIQAHSSVENDYLKDGFWAMSKEDELPNEDLYVRFLIRMEDVTQRVMTNLDGVATEKERRKRLKDVTDVITEEAVEGTHYEASVESLYYGNQYFLFVYETFRDVRLVGAPPSSIGKFGGDTDNWMWPRHTGDFSLFRIYADKNNMPSDYSEENVPYKPKKFFTISAKGIDEGDFTLVYGYPGSTRQYVHSEAVRYLVEKSNPHKINLRSMRLDVQNRYMEESAEIRIKYAKKNASVSNAWKKWQGESMGIERLNTIEEKREYERDFTAWSSDKSEYKDIVRKMAHLYGKLEPYSFARDYYNESIMANEIVRIARSVNSIAERNSNKPKDELNAMIIDELRVFYKDYHLPIDKESFILLLEEYDKNIPGDLKPLKYREMKKQYEDSRELADHLFENSVLSDSLLAYQSLEQMGASSFLDNDVALDFYKMFSNHYSREIRPEISRINEQLDLLYRTYMKGHIEYGEYKEDFYPDANSTLRIAYGNVSGYQPADAVYYKYYSTIEGIMEKDNPEIYDYNIPQELRDIYRNKDFGRWTQDGTVPVCFIATNHTSGGNSGSPVINADGELIGLNFDRVWEGTMSDIQFDPDVCRNITLDIRYVLFIMERLAGAEHLIDELEIVR